MIRLTSFSFGRGQIMARLPQSNNNVLLDGSRHRFDRALVFFELPDCDSYQRALRTSDVKFVILPKCSLYSHLAATIWAEGVRAMAIEDPALIGEAAIVYADFDSGELLVPESDADLSVLDAISEGLTARAECCGSYEQLPTNQLAGIEIRAEVISSEQLRCMLSSGAIELGVINAETVFSGDTEIDVHKRELLSLIQSLSNRKQIFLRFFDVERISFESTSTLAEPKPSLGYRGVRIADFETIWSVRFCELLQFFRRESIVIVLPMVTSAEEILKFQNRFGLESYKMGVTVETPAAALSIDEILEVVEFVQIGLNDLTQYTMAWDRDIPNEDLLPTDRIAEPVEKLIHAVITSCDLQGVPYTIGLDLPPSKTLVSQLLRIGVKSISCALSLVEPWREDLYSETSRGDWKP